MIFGVELPTGIGIPPDARKMKNAGQSLHSASQRKNVYLISPYFALRALCRLAQNSCGILQLEGFPQVHPLGPLVVHQLLWRAVKNDHPFVNKVGSVAYMQCFTYVMV
jgi:hypothetical protein